MAEPRRTSPANQFPQRTAPSISLPKGGGAIRGIGEKFATSAVSGTGSLSVPLAISPGRGSSGPRLSLTYDSGAGNGPFGLGWTLNLPSIARKTDKGIPRYDDANEGDVFVLSGAEDLVPVLVFDGTRWDRKPAGAGVRDGRTFRIHYYRPRIEGLFARIERWVADDGEILWRSISPDNVTTWYGTSAASRIVDPADSKRVFTWLIAESYDDRGNATAYEYAAENSANVDRSTLNERNRAMVNRYIRAIKYGNKQSRVANPTGFAAAGWMFRVVFDYCDATWANVSAPGADPFYVTATADTNTAAWPIRPDPFSTYRAGFEIRTYRLCRRVLMFHDFDELGDTPCLVRSTDFTYRENPIASSIGEICHSGYVRQRNAGGTFSDTYLKRSLPPLSLDYASVPTPGELAQLPVQALDSASAENLPLGLTGAGLSWVDLDGEGVTGVLAAQQSAWYYKENRGSGRFGALAAVAALPSLAAAASPQLLDLAGDGQLDVAQFDSPPGFHERTASRTWEPFRAFEQVPHVSWDDANLRAIDVTGDGHADLLLSEDDAWVWYRSLGESGFAAAERVSKALDEERGPRVVFADSAGAVFLSDMSGDGLPDIVRIRNGDVCYWPNLGYGRFGAKVAMDDAPWFDTPDQFDPSRLRLADTDGSGVADIVYLHRDGVRLYFNQAGNRWSPGVSMPQFPAASDVASIDVVDLFGAGTACLVRSSVLASEAGGQVQYLDLMAGRKPHLLTRIVNNLGAETQLEYAPSTTFYLADKLAGTPWTTRLPFPVHCVRKVVVTDKWRGSRFATTYTYHHGHYDGVEREFRGFARVNQTDTESFGAFAAGNAASPYITNDKTLYQPAVETVTWYHTGAVSDRGVLTQFRHEYFVSVVEKPLEELELESVVLSPEEWREAVRACKGIQLRQEIYELDIDSLELGEHRRVKLYSAASQTCSVRRLQPKGTNAHAVFMVADSELLRYEYEMPLTAANAAPDPRITHTLHVRLDDLGEVLQTVTAVYPRIATFSDATLPAEALALIGAVQKERHLTYTENLFTGDVDTADDYRLRALCETRTYEVTGVTPAAGFYFTLAQLRGVRFSERYQASGQHIDDLPYHLTPSGAAAKRLIEHSRRLFFSDTLTGPLAFTSMGRLGLVYGDYKLALTEPLLQGLFGNKITADVRAAISNAAASGYLTGPQLLQHFDDLSTSEWWIPSGTSRFTAGADQRFFLPDRYIDPFGNVTAIQFDGKYNLFAQSSTDPAGSTLRIETFDFRTLMPRTLKDANDNVSETYYDALGLPVAAAIKGKGTEGDDLSAYDDLLANPVISGVRTFFTGPFDEAEARRLLANATTRHVYFFGEGVDTAGLIVWGAYPPSACGILREKHAAESGASASPLQVAFEYSDGLGAVIVRKQQAEPAPGINALRWIADGKIVLNNKGNTVKLYEPYFSDGGHRFEDLQSAGVTPLMYYDAAGRLIRTELPNGTFSRVEFSAWELATYDPNDTVGDSAWYADRGSPDPAAAEPADPEEAAAWRAAAHSNTPSLTILDSIGRAVIVITHTRRAGPGGAPQDVKYLTHTKRDAEGRPLWVRDPRGNLAVQFIAPPKTDDDPDHAMAGAIPAYDIAGRLLFQHSMDSGDRWMLNDALGSPMFVWDFNATQDDASSQTSDERRRFRTEYDSLHRPLRHWLEVNEDDPVLIELFVYGDGAANDRARNLRGRLYQHFDQSGLQHIERYDFKGNSLELRRTLTNRYATAVVDWQAGTTAQLETEMFSQLTVYDALSRAAVIYNWHRGTGSRVAVCARQYNARGLLVSETLDAGATKTANGHTPSGNAIVNAIAEVRYNARGDKEYLRLANGTLTQYAYDRETFRLVQIRTTRPADESDFPQRRSGLNDPGIVQQLLYTYDPVGNVTEIYDDAFEPVWFDNQQVSPRSRFTYDALYRLIEATGRENVAPAVPPVGAEPASLSVQPPISTQALRNYRETYRYDAAGNIETVTHRTGGQGDWTRSYEYHGANNRLSRTWIGTSTWNAVMYQHDAHGNMLNLANVAPAAYLRWDYRDMIRALNLGGGGWAHYNYDASRERTRKVVDNQNGLRQWERIYLGGLEIYRRYVNGISVEEIESLHLFDGSHRLLMVDDIVMTDAAAGPRTIYRYQYNNHIGSSSMELDDQARIISYEEYYPYGASSYRAANAALDAPAKRYRNTGRERDAESGLDYHVARYYASWVGRWTACDPAGILAGLNAYAYVRDRPTTLTDRGGEGDDEAKKALQGLQKFVDQIPQKEFALLSRSEQGGRAHLTLESLLHIDLHSPARTPGGMRLAPEMLIDATGTIVGFGDPGKFGKAMAGGRTIDVALLAGSVHNLEDLVKNKVKAVDVVLAALDYKTGAAQLRRVGDMEKLIQAPYIKLTQGGNVLGDVEKRWQKAPKSWNTKKAIPLVVLGVVLVGSTAMAGEPDAEKKPETPPKRDEATNKPTNTLLAPNRVTQTMPGEIGQEASELNNQAGDRASDSIDPFGGVQRSLFQRAIDAMFGDDKPDTPPKKGPQRKPLSDLEKAAREGKRKQQEEYQLNPY